jgi:probable F420-dependent oxidoreductase
VNLGLAAAFGNSQRRDIEFMKAAAQRVEELGFDSLWFPEHVVFFPASDYQSEYPYSEDGSPPWGEEMGVYDPLLAIAVAAQVTTTLRFSTSVLILPQRPALLTAKEVLTLDHICQGRFEFGVGSGWSKEEYDALGVSFEKRGKRFDEYILAIKAAWTQDRAKFDGEFVKFENVVLLPKPYTPGGPPFLIGGDSEAAMRRSATIGDGWYGWWAKYELAPHLEKLRAELRKAGRENDPNYRLKLGIPYGGTPDDLHKKIEEARREGVKEFVMALPFSSKSLDRDLEVWAQAAGVSNKAAA